MKKTRYALAVGAFAVLVTVTWGLWLVSCPEQPDEDAVWPERLESVMGHTNTSGALTWNLVWRATKDGVVTKELPARNAVAVGRRGSTVVYSDLDTGQVYLWHPQESPPDDVSALSIPSTGSDGDMMALSPDERRMALVRHEPTRENPEEAAIRGYLVDVGSGEVKSWDWLETVRNGELVDELKWDKNSESIYVSFGPDDSDRGERSYRYDPSTGASAELAGLGAVLDVGPEGQVVGLGNSASGGAEGDPRPLVLWQAGEQVTLPSDPRVVSSHFAWISDDGRTIVVWADTQRTVGIRHCLEVLKLSDKGWEPSWLFTNDSLLVLPGIGFEPNSSIFCFQAGSYPTLSQGFPPDVGLFEFETDLNQVYYPPMRLPGASDDYSEAVGIVGATAKLGTCPEDCP